MITKDRLPFGYVTACYAGDKFMVGATLASMRHFSPEVPICLIADGDVDVSDLQQEYDLIVLRIDELPSEEMREMIGGSYRAKLAAMWEGPFEHYVWMDSDAIVWGDISKSVRTDFDFQIFWDDISIPADAEEVPTWLAHYYFNLDKLKNFDPDFEWRGHPYFSAGVYACRRNVITYEQWKECEMWGQKAPDMFKFGDQGILNYLVLANSQRGEIRTSRTDLQWVRSRDNGDIKRDCARSSWRFPSQVSCPMILHFCGRKPFTFNFRSFSRPFTIARLEHHRRKHNNLTAWQLVLTEDGRTLFVKMIGKIKRLMSGK